MSSLNSIPSTLASASYRPSSGNFTALLSRASSNFLRKLTQTLFVAIVLPGFNGAFAATTASQTPLFSVVSGAKPNLVFMLDNSGSMAFEFPEGYSLSDACKDGTDNSGNGATCTENITYSVCRTDYKSNTTYTEPTAIAGRHRPENYTVAGVTRIGCMRKSDNQWVVSSTSAQNITAATPSKHGWYKMRSSTFNSQYYNPAITYAPRIQADGTNLTNSFRFVDNQRSNGFHYIAGTGGYCYPNCTDTNGLLTSYVPRYTTYGPTAAVPTAARFSYVKCTDASCLSREEVAITNTSTASVSLPTGHARTDCGAGATSCSAALERQNILNWHEWYRNRILSVGTAVGQAMQSYDNKFRIGYGRYSSSTATTYTNSISVDRGVRYFRDETSPANRWKTDFYGWLYGVRAVGGTPSHNALQVAGNYYAKTNVATLGNPWKSNPADTSAETAAADLSCRRSYTIVLSDGAWNSGTSLGAESKFASINGTVNFSGNPGGNAAALQYNFNGAAGWDSTNATTKLTARSVYIPYADGGASFRGLADLAANYYWNTDFSALPNNVLPIPGQNNPAFWQNMTTYTIGWGLTPSGDAGVAGGLTWAQINSYINNWLAGNSTTRPSWADGRTSIDLNGTIATDSLRINDFIRAGYAGGGRAYSVYSSADVRKAIDGALSSMVGAGNDAGVAVSGNSGDFQTLENLLKYTTEYNTSNNTGDIKSFLLNASGDYANTIGGVPIATWSANDRMPPVTTRKLFSLSGYDPASPSTSAALRKEIGYNTNFSDLPTDFTALLNSNSLQRADQTFPRYLLGADGGSNTSGAVYRIRDKPIAASVNSPPVYVGGRINMGYDLTDSSVDGKDVYIDYVNEKKDTPATIFAATNSGKVHVINAATSDTALSVNNATVRSGAEIAAFMPKGAMAAQINLADPTFRFQYVLDGPLVEHDVRDSGNKTPAANSDPAWRTLVFGSGGRAGNFLYGLESPLNKSATSPINRVPTKDHFLWEVDASMTSYQNLANVTNNPTAGQLDNGRWVMLTPSGHYGGASKQVGLYVVDAFNGQLVSFIPLPAAYNNTGTAVRNRGLGGVVAVRGMDRKIAAAFAGDANGNLWRFDLRSSHFAVSYNMPVFTTPGGADQPIYAAPAWGAHPGDGTNCTYGTTTQCGAIVNIATGILLDDDDLATPATRQGIFGVWDPTPIGSDDKAGFTTINSSQLVEQTITLGSAIAGSGSESTGKTFYQVSSNAVDWTSKRGWFMNLGVITMAGAMTNGERVISDLANIGSSVRITSFLPEASNLSIESCTASGSLPNIMYVLDASTGGNKYSFDINSDGRADLYSIMAIPAGGYTRGTVTSRNSLGLPNEGDVKLKPKVTCTDETAFETGNVESAPIFDACPTVGWRRTWRPVISPPF
ncbi:pilus assembly protein [Ottowia thiooxydans]|uniref:pilus assembly protein n=1 Tax=Ottowia thiooxydans TaxID=219182 RepID=UPI001FDEDEEF|nr:PilC/PilY family type IV pilus protein [Ottowia thiooxydans]